MPPLIYVACDYNSQRENLDLARELASSVSSDRFGFKVNLDTVLSFGQDSLSPYSVVREMLSLGKPLFVDLKMWNGARTMANIAEGCASLGVDMINMYPHAEGKFMTQVVKAIEGSNTKLFGLTVLTHYTDDYCRAIYGLKLVETVRMLTEISVESGAHGIILPGTQLENVKDFKTLKLVPAIRPDWFMEKGANYQEQTVTPQEAISGGADILVVGSPILKAANKAEALERIISEI